MPSIDNKCSSTFIIGVIISSILFAILVICTTKSKFSNPSGGIKAPAKYVSNAVSTNVPCDSYEMNLPNSICKCPDGNKPDYDDYFSNYDKGALSVPDSYLEVKIYNNYSYPLHILHTKNAGNNNGEVIDKFTINPKSIYILNDNQLRSAAQRFYVFLSKPSGWNDLVVGKESKLGQGDGAGLIEFDGTGNGGTTIAFDISHVDYTTIPIYVVARDSNHKRYIEPSGCTSPMIYSGANCSNNDMVKGCPTEIKNVNCMKMCLAPTVGCVKGKDGDTIPSYCHDLDSVLNLFPDLTDEYVRTKLGANDGVQQFLYGNLSGELGLSGTTEMAKSNHPFIYRPLIAGIMTGRCNLQQIADGSCVGSTAIGCQENGGNGNLFPILPNYRDSYKDSHTLDSVQMMTGAVGCGSGCGCNPPKSGASGCWCKSGFCQAGTTTDWNETDINNGNPYNKYAKWSASHGNGRFYSYPFDDTRGTIIPSKPMAYLDIVLFPDCGKHSN